MRLIDADAAIDAVVGCTNCGTEDVLRAYVTKHSLENGWTGGIVDALDAIEELPVFNRDIAIEAICDEVMLWFDVSATRAYEIADTAVKRIEVRMEKIEGGAE